MRRTRELMSEENAIASIPGNPPRIGIAGKTGTYQIVFDNGAIVTLEKVQLLTRHTPGQPEAYVFKTHYQGGQSGEAAFKVKNERVIGIFLLKEDLNT
jgi:hypothetical protein